MADNVTLNSMAGGSVVATDDSGTGHVQLVKLAQSGNGSRTHVEADSNGLWVVPQRVTPANVVVYKHISTSGTNDTFITSATTYIRIHGFHVANMNSSMWSFLKFYDCSITPYVGSDQPVMTIGCPPGQTTAASYPFGFIIGASQFGFGIGITQSPDDYDMSSVGSQDVAVNIMYEVV